MRIYTNGWVLLCPGLGNWWFSHRAAAEDFGRCVLGHGWAWKVVPA